MSIEPTSAVAPQPTETHYVWVIHGTFNPPEPGTVKWFEMGRNGVSTFCDALSKRFEGTPLQGACLAIAARGDGFCVVREERPRRTRRSGRETRRRDDRSGKARSDGEGPPHRP